MPDHQQVFRYRGNVDIVKKKNCAVGGSEVLKDLLHVHSWLNHKGKGAQSTVIFYLGDDPVHRWPHASRRCGIKEAAVSDDGH